MSGKISGLVWDLRIPPLEKYVLECYADHADHEGKNIYPAIALVVWKTGLSEREVQKLTRSLESEGLLMADGKGPHGVNRWKIPLLDSIVVPWGGVHDVHPAGGAPVHGEAPGGARATGEGVHSGAPEPKNLKPSTKEVVVTAPAAAEYRKARAAQPEQGGGDVQHPQGGDVQHPPQQPITANKEVVVTAPAAAEIFRAYEAEIGPITPMIADAISAWLDDEHMPAEWIVEAMQIAVKNGVRKWRYIESILKDCQAKKVRPSENRLERKHANTGTGTSQQQPAKPALTQGDLATAARINAANRARRGLPTVP